MDCLDCRVCSGRSQVELLARSTFVILAIVLGICHRTIPVEVFPYELRTLSECQADDQFEVKATVLPS